VGASKGECCAEFDIFLAGKSFYFYDVDGVKHGCYWDLRRRREDADRHDAIYEDAALFSTNSEQSV
jgi:hypothetical protein